MKYERMTMVARRTAVAMAAALGMASAGAMGCASGSGAAMPLEAGPSAAPEQVLVWVGRGEAERFEGGKWVRVPSFDYDFSVEQRRFRDHWQSVKTMRRAHPDYDGSAGPREQVLWFRLDFREGGAGASVPGAVRSRLGDGTIATDREFRAAEIEIRPDISSHAPFDTYRIRQRYLYEDGRLEETVELFDHDDGREVPWVVNREQAELFTAQRLPGPPTTR